MDITIIETGERAELSIIDPKSGCDWTNDLLGNHDALPEYNDDDGTYHMSQADYAWWSDLIERYQIADDRYHELLHNVSNGDYEALQEDASQISVDLDNYPEALQAVCNNYSQED